MSSVTLGRTLGSALERMPDGDLPSDMARLVRDIAEKKPGAEKALVDRFKGHVHRLLARMLGPGPDLEDLLQETLFRVFQRLDKVVPPEALPGYVTAVAVLVAREAIRKRKRARWLSFFATEDLAKLDSQGGAADIPEDVRAFYGLLGKLPEHAQLCLTLRHVEGMGLAELALATGVSLATAKRHLARAEEDIEGLLARDESHILPWLRKDSQ